MEQAFVRPNRVPNRSLANRPKGRSAQKPKSKGRRGKSVEGQGKLVVMRLKGVYPIVRRKFATGGTIVSSAGGQITIVTLSFGDIVTSLGSEWSNFAQEFQEYRPLNFRMTVVPSTTNATSTTGPYQAMFILCPWQQFRISSANTMYQSGDLVKMSTLEEKEIMIIPSMPNDKLWNVSGATLVADRDFGITYTNIGVVAVSSNIFTYLVEIEAEFKIPQ